MAQYIPFANGVEVNGKTILSFTQALKVYESLLVKVLYEHGITELNPDCWYDQEQWLKAFREVGNRFGGNTLFSLGKAIPEHAEFPSTMKDLQEALSAIDVAYHMNHRGGEIGYYKVLKFDAGLKTALVECRNPYPSDFDRGLITAIVRKFKPATSIVSKVELDADKPSRLNGADSCTYKVTW